MLWVVIFAGIVLLLSDGAKIDTFQSLAGSSSYVDSSAVPAGKWQGASTTMLHPRFFR